MTESEEYQEALLLLLGVYEDDRLPITEATERAQALARVRRGTRDLAYSTQRNARRKLEREGLVTFEEHKGHYYIGLTEAGEGAVAKIPLEVPPAETDQIPDLPFRLGGPKHRLPRRAWSDLLMAVKKGEVELIAVRAAQRTSKIKYWDEGDEDDEI
jgi:hypothetical protein